MSNNKVVKSNALIQASYRITLQEQRLLLCAISKIDSRANIEQEVTISAKEFSELMCIPLNEAYKQMSVALDNLFERSVFIQISDDEVEEFRWIEMKRKKSKGDGKVSFSWTTPVMEYLSNLKGSYTDYRLKHIVPLTSSHAIRLYELLMQYRAKNERMISVKDFRFYMGTGKMYPEFKTLNQKLIQPALNQINEKSNLNVALSLHKDGREISALQFDFNEKIS